MPTVCRVYTHMCALCAFFLSAETFSVLLSFFLLRRCYPRSQDSWWTLFAVWCWWYFPVTVGSIDYILGGLLWGGGIVALRCSKTTTTQRVAGPGYVSSVSSMQLFVSDMLISHGHCRSATYAEKPRQTSLDGTYGQDLNPLDYSIVGW